MENNKIICPVEKTLEIIGGSWKVRILDELFKGTKRFNELRRSVNGITQKMLTQQLRDLEKHRIVNRKVYPIVPPKIEYSLTRLGMSLKPIIDAIHDWGERHLS
ncbi:MAG: winged helix-turn-helix transcriptional regulator [bacterium]